MRHIDATKDVMDKSHSFITEAATKSNGVYIREKDLVTAFHQFLKSYHHESEKVLNEYRMQLLQKDLDSKNVVHYCEVSDLMSDTDQPTESDDNMELFCDLREDRERWECSGH